MTYYRCHVICVNTNMPEHVSQTGDGSSHVPVADCNIIYKDVSKKQDVLKVAWAKA